MTRDYEEEDRKHKEWRRRQDRRFYTGLFIAIVLAMTVIIGVTWWAHEGSARKADRVCGKLSAEPLSVGDGRYICLSPDGRVVGNS